MGGAQTSLGQLLANRASIVSIVDCVPVAVPLMLLVIRAWLICPSPELLPKSKVTLNASGTFEFTVKVNTETNEVVLPERLEPIHPQRKIAISRATIPRFSNKMTRFIAR
jgi:hypothetical protein